MLTESGQRLLAAGRLTCLGFIAATLRVCEFQGIQFYWDDNAYASTVWSILVLHLVYLIVAAAEAAILLVWLWRYGLDDKRVLDVTLTAVYWYWTVVVGALFISSYIGCHDWHEVQDMSQTSMTEGADPLGYLWLALVLGPAAWAIQLEGEYMLAEQACREHLGATILHALSCACFAIALLGFALAFRYWYAFGLRSPHGEENNQLGRGQFMAMLAVLITALSSLAIIAQWVAVSVLPYCPR